MSDNALDVTEAVSHGTRHLRDTLLKETDFWALSDVTMTDEMRAYRQALRDLPDQQGFPHNVVWPTKPE